MSRGSDGMPSETLSQCARPSAVANTGGIVQRALASILSRRPTSLIPSASLLALICCGFLACSGSTTTTTTTSARGPQPAAIRRVLAVPAVASKTAPAPARPPRGPFGFSLVATADNKAAKISDFEPNSACAECHPRQEKELQGSAHSIAHVDSLYRRTAELARAEAGPEVYAYCSGCHAPQAVASALIPKMPENKLPPVAKAGVLCDTCHQISALTGHKSPWGEPANASFILAAGSGKKYGPPTGNNADADHAAEARPFFQRSEFCASCHTIIHPTNGVRIEHTYGEWKKSVYAQRGVQCQDCHMRTVEQAKQVAATMKPQVPHGQSSPEGKQRPIAHHYFVGGSASIDALGGGAASARMAEARLKSAARLSIKAPQIASAAMPLRFTVNVENHGAGHNLPTSLTELRQMWVELTVTSAAGELLFRSGALTPNGDIGRDAMRFYAEAGDKDGKLTYKPWEITHFLWKRLIPPKATAIDEFTVPLPPHATGQVKIQARLLYRSAPPAVLKLLFGAQPPHLKTVEMAAAESMTLVR